MYSFFSCPWVTFLCRSSSFSGCCRRWWCRGFERLPFSAGGAKFRFVGSYAVGWSPWIHGLSSSTLLGWSSGSVAFGRVAHPSSRDTWAVWPVWVFIQGAHGALQLGGTQTCGSLFPAFGGAGNLCSACFEPPHRCRPWSRPMRA